MVDPGNTESAGSPPPEATPTLDREALGQQVRMAVGEKARKTLINPDGTPRGPVAGNIQEEGLRNFQLVVDEKAPTFNPGGNDIIINLPAAGLNNARLAAVEGLWVDPDNPTAPPDPNVLKCHFQNEQGDWITGRDGVPFQRDTVADLTIAAYADNLSELFEGDDKTNFDAHAANVKAKTGRQETAENTQDTGHPADSMIALYVGTLDEKNPEHQSIIATLNSAKDVPGPLGAYAREAAVNQAIAQLDKSKPVPPSLAEAKRVLQEGREDTHDALIDSLNVPDDQRDALGEFLDGKGDPAAKILELLNRDSKNQLIKSLHENPGFADDLLAGTDKERLMAFLDNAVATMGDKNISRAWGVTKTSLKVGGVGLGAILVALLAAAGLTLAGGASIARSAGAQGR